MQCQPQRATATENNTHTHTLPKKQRTEKNHFKSVNINGLYCKQGKCLKWRSESEFRIKSLWIGVADAARYRR